MGAWCSTQNNKKGQYVSENYAYCDGSPCDPGTLPSDGVPREIQLGAMQKVCHSPRGGGG